MGQGRSCPTSSPISCSTRPSTTRTTSRPRWLNEGLAVYLSRGYDSSDRDGGRRGRRRRHAGAADQPGRRLPATATGSSSPTRRASRRSTTWSGPTASRPSSKLIRSYAQGLTDDEAFKAALGVDMTAFDTGWRKAPGREADGQHGTAAGPGRSAAVRLDRLRPGRRLRATGAPSPGSSASSGAPAATTRLRPGLRRRGWPGGARLHSAWAEHRRGRPRRPGGRDRRGDLRRLPGPRTRPERTACDEPDPRRTPALVRRRELAGHPRARPPRPRLPHRRPAQLAGAAHDLHEPGARAARPDGARAPGPAGPAEAEPARPADADPGRRGPRSRAATPPCGPSTTTSAKARISAGLIALHGTGPRHPARGLDDQVPPGGDRVRSSGDARPTCGPSSRSSGWPGPRRSR